MDEGFTKRSCATCRIYSIICGQTGSNYNVLGTCLWASEIIAACPRIPSPYLSSMTQKIHLLPIQGFIKINASQLKLLDIE